MGDMAINVRVQKQIVIDIIANVLDQDYIALIAIAKIAKINLLKIVLQIGTQLYRKISQKLNLLHVLVLKVVAIKSIVNAIKMVLNVILLVDVLAVKILKIEKNSRKNFMNAVWLIVFIL